MNKPNDIDLDKRLEYLEQANFFKMMALDLARELGEFNSSISQLKDPGAIFENCQTRARQMIGFKQIAFFLVSEEDSGFYPYCCYPDTDKEVIEQEIDVLVEDGTFSRAVLEKIPVTAYSKDSDQQLLLHVLATASRVRGMFVGVLEKNSKHIQEAAFEIFSILMAHCANALESYELYSQLKASNIQLQKKVNQLSQSQSCLKDEILEHEKTEAALEASERQYRLLAETAREMILVVSEQKKITYANPAALTTCGYEQAGMKDLSIIELIDKFDTIFAENLLKDQPVQTAHILSASGDRIPLEITIVPIFHENKMSGYLLIGRDISSRLKAEQDRKDLETKLWQARKMESIGLLASGIAHDFNNILSVIVNYTTLSIVRIHKDDPAFGYLQNVQKASERAVLLARKLYTIGRNDDHQTIEINVVSTIKDTVDLLKSSLGNKIALKTRFQLDKLTILAEETRIQQVLMNLITNAVHAMGNCSGTITVSAFQVSVSKATPLSVLDLLPGSYIKISVSDDGPGIEVGVLQQIFEPYFSTKIGKDNSGLGLSVVHGVVKNYKGGIDIDTQQGVGTAFHIYLPEFKPTAPEL
ncbi:MAG: ATP-binding protein [Pseudomonadota bacterium]